MIDERNFLKELLPSPNFLVHPTTYSKDYFASIDEGSKASALAILGILFALHKPRSVVDLGCGTGAWLAAAGSLGAEELLGYDGDWANPPAFSPNRITFTPVDFENSQPVIENKADLAISVEVLEHISPDRAGCFLDALCSASDVIVFSAAIPHQGGTRHLNEQPQSHWIRQFDLRGFDVFDIFRPAIWSNDSVCWWYRQNTLLFVHRGAAVPDRGALRACERPIHDVVHPSNYVQKLRVLRERIKKLESNLVTATARPGIGGASYRVN